MKYLIAAAALFVASPTLAVTTVVNFDNYNINPATSISGPGSYVIQTGSNNIGAAPPGNTTPYLSVIGRQTLTFSNFIGTLDFISFYWGSNDKYNEVRLLGSNGKAFYAKEGWVSGNQFNAADNTVFTYILTPANKLQGFSGVELVSHDRLGQRAAIEIDNLVLQSYVPEPVSWALMLVGFGLTGAAIRGRRYGVVAA
jgi:hypothetical protein